MNETNPVIIQDFETDPVDPEQVQRYFATKLDEDAELRMQMEENFVTLLDSRQAQIYRQLPENEKAFIRNRWFAESDANR